MNGSEIIRQVFFSPTRGACSFVDVLADILSEAQRDPGRTLRVSVGTDSEDVGQIVKHVTIVHLWRVGRGARAYRIEFSEPALAVTRGEIARIRQRIWREVTLTVTLAQELRSALRDAHGGALCDAIEVHADVGENGKSSVMIREVIGVLKGYGFADDLIKLKPEAYAASAVADHYI